MTLVHDQQDLLAEVDKVLDDAINLPIIGVLGCPGKVLLKISNIGAVNNHIVRGFVGAVFVGIQKGLKSLPMIDPQFLIVTAQLSLLALFTALKGRRISIEFPTQDNGFVHG